MTLAALGLLLVAFMLAARPAQGMDIDVNVAGGLGVYPGDIVPITVVQTFDASETIDTQQLEVTILGVQTFQFLVPLTSTQSVTLHSGAGILRGNVTLGDDIVVGGTGLSATGTADDATITFSGTFTVPFSAPGGNYVVRARMNDNSQSFQAVGSFRVLEEEDPSATPAQPTPGPRSAPVVMRPRNYVEIPAGQILENFQAQVRAALGSDEVRILGGNAPIVNENGSLVVRIPGLNISSSMSVRGPINLNAPHIELTTNDGAGTVILHLGDGIELSANVTIVPRANRLDLVLSNVVMRLTPPSPDMSLLTGGSSSVTSIGVAFEFGLSALPDGTGWVITFAKDGAELFGNLSEILDEVAEALEGVIDPATDFAFGVEVEQEVITNDEVGDNNVTLLVNQSWYNDRSGEDKTIVIFKVDEDGNVHVLEASCVAAGSGNMSCQAEFTGEAGGFSIYALAAVGEEEEVEPTPTVTPTPTPTPTVPSTEPPSEGGNALIIIVIVVLVVVAVGGGAFLFLRRRPSASGQQ